MEYNVKPNDTITVHFDGGAAPRTFMIKRSSQEPFVVLSPRIKEQTSFPKCVCDCGCSKQPDYEDTQCDDCDNGIHWNELYCTYVNYEDDDE